MWARENPYSGIFYAVPLISVFVIFPSNVCTCSEKKMCLKDKEGTAGGFQYPKLQQKLTNSQILHEIHSKC